MSAEPGVLQTFAFGELSTGIWGAALTTAGEPPFLCLGASGAAAAADGQIAGSGSQDEWRLIGDTVELTLTPAGEPVDPRRPENEIGGFDQLCRFSGRFSIEGTEHEVSSLGWRGVRSGVPDVSRYESLREVSAWFEPGAGLALAAFRPRKAKGHGCDVISASVFDQDTAAAVEDPRLSTTYTEAGWPARVSLELWLAGEDEHQLLRRAACEPTGSRVQSRWGDLEVRAELLRCHSRDHAGAGVYLLAGAR
jgi:hypothetical protein